MYDHHRRQHERSQLHNYQLVTGTWDLPRRKSPPLTFENDPAARRIIDSATHALVHSFAHPPEAEHDHAQLPSPPIQGLSSWLPDDAFNPGPSLEEEELQNIHQVMEALEKNVWSSGELWAAEEEEHERIDVNLEAGACC